MRAQTSGDWAGGIPIPEPITLGSTEERLEGQNKESFLRMMNTMLQWDPAKRLKASDLVHAEWIVQAMKG